MISNRLSTDSNFNKGHIRITGFVRITKRFFFLQKLKIEEQKKKLKMQQDSHAEDRVLRCAHCKIHLAMVDDIVSKTFHGRRGRAFLLHAMYVVLPL